MTLQGLDEQELEFRDPPRLIFLRVQDAIDLIWRENLKLHDIGGLVNSIVQYGMQEFPKYDATLEAIKSGNGRIEALYQMEKSGDYALPRGCAKTKEGDWVVPIIVGQDANSVALAKAYALDANNLTLTGGDLEVDDMLRMWDYGVTEQLTDMAGEEVFTVAIDQDVLDMLMLGPNETAEPPTLDDLADEFGDPEEQDFWPVIKVKVSPDTFAEYEAIMTTMPGLDEAERFAALLSRVSLADD